MNKIFTKASIPYFVIAALIIYILMINKKEVVELVIESKKGSVEIKDPIPEKRIDTVFIDSKNKSKGFRVVEVENPVNKELLQKYEEAVRLNDSIKQKALFKEAIEERLYTEKLEDSVQIITVKSEVIGTLKSQIISYETKPDTIVFKTNRTKPSFYFGGFTSVQTAEEIRPAFGLQIQLVNKKRAFAIGYDTNKNINVNYLIKL